MRRRVIKVLDNCHAHRQQAADLDKLRKKEENKKFGRILGDGVVALRRSPPPPPRFFSKGLQDISRAGLSHWRGSGLLCCDVPVVSAILRWCF